jgi:hypothetical protein
MIVVYNIFRVIGVVEFDVVVVFVVLSPLGVVVAGVVVIVIEYMTIVYRTNIPSA